MSKAHQEVVSILSADDHSYVKVLVTQINLRHYQCVEGNGSSFTGYR